MKLQQFEDYTDAEWAKIALWLLDGSQQGILMHNPLYNELYFSELEQLRTLITYQPHYTSDELKAWAKSINNQLLAEIALSIHIVAMRRIVFMKCQEAYVDTEKWDFFRLDDMVQYDYDYPNGRGYPSKMKDKKSNSAYWFMYWFEDFLKGRGE